MSKSQWTEPQLRALHDAVAAGEDLKAVAARLGKRFETVKSYVRRRHERNEPLWTPPVERVDPTTVKPPTPVPVDGDAPPGAVCLCDRTGCAWPVHGGGADTLFCNAVRAPGTTYCADHTQRMINPAVRRKPGAPAREFRLAALGVARL